MFEIYETDTRSSVSLSFMVIANTSPEFLSIER